MKQLLILSGKGGTGKTTIPYIPAGRGRGEPVKAVLVKLQ
jgi:MinD superfamily P-loop ATPase